MDMDINALQKAQELAQCARALSPSQREAWLRQHCGADDPTLISQVLALLEQDTVAAAHWQPQNVTRSETLVGQRLGSYELKRLLGSGGMGEVYLAERADQEYRHRVAIKLVRGTLITDDVRARLRTERQILAHLHHPYIATLLDGGTAPDGTPYLVMEYIDGVPIDAYCDHQSLTIEQRLRLFCKVCEAVHYAHQNLIVHRDLKPGNILVTPQGEPKLLDFGIAKLLERQFDYHDAALTQHDIRVLTPANASPEQIRGEPITTASDVYGLGVLLYELLCGKKPWKLPASGRLSELEQLICHTTPSLPSAASERVTSETPDFAELLAQCRHTTPARLVRQLSGDLDNIVMMALRREASRRYASVEQFSHDLQHWLDHQPVLATRDSWRYRSTRFIRRHAVLLGASSLALLLLVGFSAVTYVQSQNIARQRDAANAERRRAEQVSNFLVQLFELSDPGHSRGEQLKARELLDTGVKRLDSELQNLPGTRGALQATIGSVYGSLGLYDDAIQTLQKALENQRRAHPGARDEVADTLLKLGQAQLEQGRLEDAEKQFNAALAMQQELHGRNAAELIETYSQFGVLARARGDFLNAQQYFKQALSLCDAYPERKGCRADILNELGKNLSEQYQDAEAEPLYREALALYRSSLGNDHPQVAGLIDRLAESLQSQHRFVEAEALFKEALQINRRVLGNQHPQTAEALENYGYLLMANNKLGEAESVYKEALTINKAVYGEQHSVYAYDLVNLGLVHYSQNALATAEQEFRQALDIYGRTIGNDHVLVIGAKNALGLTLHRSGKVREAIPLIKEGLQLSVAKLGNGNLITQTARATLGIALQDIDRTQSIVLLRQAAAAIRNGYGEKTAFATEVRETLKKFGLAADGSSDHPGNDLGAKK